MVDKYSSWSDLVRSEGEGVGYDAIDSERLDVHNGLLLVSHLDIAFDKGLITVQDDGTVIVSDKLPERERRVLGLTEARHVDGLRKEHWPYLPWHRDYLFRR